MARGVTEKDVHGAADALVSAGERPTVERIRAQLGTGSPNTVTRLLDTWWQALPARLAAHGRSMGLPDAPPAVATLASEFWQLALSAAQVEAERSVAGEREALVDARSQLDTDRVAFEAAAAAAAAELAALHATVTLLEARLRDSERVVAEQAAHSEELRTERRASAEREGDSQRNVTQLRTELDVLRDAAAEDRRRLERHVEHVESRAATEIDRARQSQRSAEAALQGANKLHAAELRALKALSDRATKTATTASLEATRQRARADTLAKTLAAQRVKQRTPAHTNAKRRPAVPRKVEGTSRTRRI